MVYGLNPSDDAFQDTMAANNYVTPQPEMPGAFEGIPTAVGRGLEQGELQIGNLATATFSPDTSELFQDAMKSARPDPKTTGFVANTLYDLAKMAPALSTAPFTGGVAAAALLGGSSGLAKYQEEAPIVGEKTAGEEALLEGGTNALFGVIPGAVGVTRTAKILSGAAINAGVGAVSEGLNGTILRANGYDEMADQYKYFDATNIATAAVLGGIMGAIHSPAKTQKDITDNIDAALPSQTDAALAGNNQINLEKDTAPGVPLNIETRNAHVDTVAANTPAVLMGDDLNVDKVMKNGDFVEKPQDPEVSQAIEDAQKDAYYDRAEALGMEYIPPDLDDLMQAVHEREAIAAQDDSMMGGTGRDETPNPAQEANDYVTQKGMETGNEHVVAIDNNTGEITHRETSGRPGSVDFSADLEEKLNNPNNNYSLHHNHPDSAIPVSMEDIVSMERPGLREVVAKAPNGRITSAQLTDSTREQLSGKTRSEKESYLASQHNQAYEQAVNEFMNTPDATKATPEQAGEYTLNRVNQVLAEKGIIKYTDSRDTINNQGSKNAGDTTKSIRPESEDRGIHQRDSGSETNRPDQANNQGREGIAETERQVGQDESAGQDPNYNEQLAQQILAEKPDAVIPGDNGEPISAEQAMAESENIDKNADEMANATKAAIECFIRYSE